MGNRSRAKIYLGLGSNLGDSRVLLGRAVEMLRGMPQTTALRCSSLYESAPLGGLAQRHYINMAVVMYSHLDPQSLLAQTAAIEAALGRVRCATRWEARTMDIDILLYGTLQLRERNLVIPHPSAHLRDFVLQPLLELDRNVYIPGKGLAREFVEHCANNGLRRIGVLN